MVQHTHTPTLIHLNEATCKLLRWAFLSERQAINSWSIKENCMSHFLKTQVSECIGNCVCNEGHRSVCDHQAKMKVVLPTVLMKYGYFSIETVELILSSKTWIPENLKCNKCKWPLGRPTGRFSPRSGKNKWIMPIRLIWESPTSWIDEFGNSEILVNCTLEVHIGIARRAID